MREIKFRAYDSANKVMEYNVNVNQGKPVKQGYQWFDSGNTVYHSDLMQFTGLYDKHHKPIYEGDIVRIKGHALQRDKRGIGIDIDGNYVVKWSEKMELILASSPESKEGWLLSKNLHYIEVIGNIFEHKHLLEVDS